MAPSLKWLAFIAMIPALALASCRCSVSGDPHFVGCDGVSLYDWQGTGLYSLFKTDDVELQCNLDYPRNSDGSIEHQMFTFVNTCRLSVVSKPGCEYTLATGGFLDQQSVQIGDQKMSLDQAAAFVQDHSATANVQVSIDPVAAKITAVVQSKQGQITLVVEPYQVHIVADETNQCDGMCGKCTGVSEVPKDMQAWAAKYGADGTSSLKPILPKANVCSNLSAPAATREPLSPLASATISPTIVPSNASGTTIAPVSEPVGSNDTLRVGKVEMGNPIVVPENPVFESESVLREVIDQCMCGQPKARFTADPLFGKFVENCVYDKSFPGGERLAMSNMKSFSINQLAASTNSSSFAMLDLSMCGPILTPIVTKRVDQIPATEGISYMLQYTKPINMGQVPKAAYLKDRPAKLTGTGESCEQETKDILKQANARPLIPAPTSPAIIAHVPSRSAPLTAQQNPSGAPLSNNMNPASGSPQITNKVPTGSTPQNSIPNPNGSTPQNNMPNPNGSTPQNNMPNPNGSTPQNNMPNPNGSTPQNNMPNPNGSTPQNNMPNPNGSMPMHNVQTPSSSTPLSTLQNPNGSGPLSNVQDRNGSTPFSTNPTGSMPLNNMQHPIGSSPLQNSTGLPRNAIAMTKSLTPNDHIPLLNGTSIIPDAAGAIGSPAAGQHPLSINSTDGCVEGNSTTKLVIAARPIVGNGSSLTMNDKPTANVTLPAVLMNATTVPTINTTVSHVNATATPINATVMPVANPTK